MRRGASSHLGEINGRFETFRKAACAQARLSIPHLNGQRPKTAPSPNKPLRGKGYISKQDLFCRAAQ